MRFRFSLLAVIFLSSICAPILSQDSNVKLSKSNLEEARQIIHQASNAAMSIQNPYDQSEVLARIAGLQVVLGDLQSARSSVSAIQEEPARDFESCRLADELAQLGNFDSSVSVAQAIRDEQKRYQCLSVLGQMRAKNGETTLGVSTAYEIDDPGLRSFYLSGVAVSAACGHHGEAATRIFQLAVEEIETIPNPERKLFVSLETANRRAFCDPEGALAMLPQLQKRISEIKDEDKQMELTFLVIDIQANAKNLDGAIQTAISANDNQRDSYLPLIIYFQIEAGKLVDALSTFKLIQNTARKDQALADIATAFAANGDFTEAMNAAKTISSEAQRDFPYMNIALAQAKTKQFQQAVAVAHLISTDFLEVGTLTKIAELVPIEDPNGTAEKVLSDAASIAKKTGGNSTESFRIAAVQAERGDLKEAFETMESMQEDSTNDAAAKYKASVKENLAFWLSRTGKKSDALVWFGRERSAYSRAFISIGIVEALLDRIPPNIDGAMDWDLLREKGDPTKQL